jgi:hypothetical protein
MKNRKRDGSGKNRQNRQKQRNSRAVKGWDIKTKEQTGSKTPAMKWICQDRR